MSLSPDIIRKLNELTILPVDDPQRVQFVASLPAADPALRQYWSALQREEQLLRESLVQVPMPANLLEQLLSLPEAPQAPAKKSWKNVSIPWPVAAAAVFAVLIAGGTLYWTGGFNRSQTVMTPPPPAPRDAVDKLTLLAVSYHVASAALDVPGTDAATLTINLQAKASNSMPFPVVIPKVPPEYHLLGGSILPFGAGPAIYTRWQRDGHIYSLYQFAPDNVGMPRQFARQSSTSKQSPTSPFRMSLWPGYPDGGCTWVAVSDVAAPTEPFSGSY